MTENTKNITSMPYAKWLEETLHDISSMPVNGIALTCTLEGGEAYTNYWNVPMGSKILISGLIQQDAMLDTMAANGILEYSDDDGVETDETAEDDEEDV